MRDRIRSYVVRAAVVVCAGLSVLFLLRSGQPVVEPPASPEPEVAETQHVSVEDTLSRGETLYSSLLSKGISPAKAVQMLSALGERLNLRCCGTGDSYTASLDETGAVVSMLYRKGMKQLFKVRSDSAGYVVSQASVEPAGLTRRVEGRLTSCLWDAFTSMGEDPRLALKLADVFAWEIDFLTDPRAGDNFVIVYEELRYPSGETEIGDILCARYVNEGREHLVFRFADEDGGIEYYDSDGNSARRVFLKSPLNYRRISSYFSNRRFHPILKIYRPHYGVDYAAPSGTPVVSIGEGRIVRAGWNGGFGKYVEIRHNGVYTSCYGHLSGYGSGISQGARVSQGQVIGYVGATGLATGPHLDFRIKRFGSYVNPLTIDCPRAEPVTDERKPAFFEIRDTLLRALNPGSGLQACNLLPSG
jgi:murein DD-endopeptidase MepM/ murein hydrolase activator NlpD